MGQTLAAASVIKTVMRPRLIAAWMAVMLKLRRSRSICGAVVLVQTISKALSRRSYNKVPEM